MRSFSVCPEIPPTLSREVQIPTIIPLLISLNIAVFLSWIFVDSGSSPVMIDNFLVSWSALAEGRYWTVVTSVFSHNMFWHLFLNMYVLYSFGPIVETVLGRMRFVRFYLIAGIVSSLSHSLVSLLLLDRPDLPALGASGAISGIVVLFSFLFPRQKILVFGLIPIAAGIGAVLFVLVDLWGLAAQAGGGGLPIGHGAHLGGAAVGLIYYLLYFRNRKVPSGIA